MEYVVIGLLWLGLAIYKLVIWIKRDGPLFFLDASRLMLLIWLVAGCLYDFTLSWINQPTLEINAVIMLVAATLLLFEGRTNSDIALLKERCGNPVETRYGRAYWICLAVMMALCVLAFLANAQEGMLRLINGNPGKEVDLQMGYLYRLSVPITIASYFMFRSETKLAHKAVWAFVATAFTLLTVCDLSRGPILWIMTGVIVTEVYLYLSKGKRASRRAVIGGLVAAIALGCVFVVIFGAFGDSRAIKNFGMSAGEFYQMKINLPSGLNWIYIYLTTPLENASQALANYTGESYNWFANLFYPFVKLICDLFGQGGAFVSWLEQTRSVETALIPGYGLTVGTFVLDALQDLGVVGVFVYVGMYLLVIKLIKLIIRVESIRPVTIVTLYSLLIQVPLWSVFDNSVFRGLAPIWVCCAIVVLAEVISNQKFRDNAVSKLREIMRMKKTTPQPNKKFR